MPGHDNKLYGSYFILARLPDLKLILLVTALLFFSLPITATRADTIQIGVLAKRGDEQCLQRWSATADYLSKEIPEHSFQILPLGFDEIHSAVHQQTIDFVLANSSFYVDLEVQSKAQRIATLKKLHSSGSFYTFFSSVIFCRSDRQDLQSLQDLKNSTFMGVNPRSFGGWQISLRLLLNYGINPQKDFEKLEFGGSHDAVVYAVRDGLVDAGCVRSDTIEQMVFEGKIQLEDFKLLHPHHGCGDEFKFLHSGPHHPEWPLAKLAHTSDLLAEKVAIALIRMPAQNQAALAAHVAGWSIPQNYRPVHECLMELGLSPYENYGRVTLKDVIGQYWLWILCTLILTLLIIIFIIRSANLKSKLEQSLQIRQERKIAEAERERLVLAIEQVEESVVITDIEGNILFVNGAFEKKTGYSAHEALQTNVRILKSGKHDDRLYREMWKTVLKGETWVGRLINRKKNGDLFTEEVTISPVRNPYGETVNFVAVKRDITIEIKKEEHFRQAQKMDSVGRLAGGLAHDFNNMLGVIMGYTDMALEDVDPALPLHQDLQEIKFASERSADLTRQLLAFARKQTITPQVLNLNSTLSDMLNMLHRLIGEDIDLEWQPESDIWPVKMDPSQVDQILVNLCVNARDAIDGVGKIIIETKNVVFDTARYSDHPEVKPGQFVQLAVSDDGCGMSKDILNNIFEPFFTTKDMGLGTGLGLATIYGIVKQNDGFINVYSEEGQGTTFRIYLPKAGDFVEELDSSLPGIIPLTGQETILLVEDEPSLLKLTSNMLNKLGYNILSASTPKEAIRLMEEAGHPIHLLLTDVVMPEMNGRDLAKILLAKRPAIKPLFMSGYTSNVIAHHGVLDEGVDFIAKPFVLAELGEKIRAVLDRS